MNPVKNKEVPEILCEKHGFCFVLEDLSQEW